MDRSTVDDSCARAQEAGWDDFASTSTTRQWEGSLRVAEQAMSLFFISIMGGRGDRARQVGRTKIRTKKPPLTRAIPATRRTRCIPSRKVGLPFRIAPST